MFFAPLNAQGVAAGLLIRVSLVRFQKEEQKTFNATIAQLVEQRTCNATVEGSIPFGGTNLYYEYGDMKTNNHTTEDIETFLISNNLVPSLKTSHLRNIFNNVSYERSGVWKDGSQKNRERLTRIALCFTRRDVLLIKYKWNGYSANGIKEGHVYAITNPAWPDYVKIGSAIDVYDRLGTYQTSSPFRNYKLESYIFSYDRLKTEKILHNMFPDRNGEWVKCNIDDIKKLFSDIIKKSFTDDKDTMLMQCYKE